MQFGDFAGCDRCILSLLCLNGQVQIRLVRCYKCQSTMIIQNNAEPRKHGSLWVSQNWMGVTEKIRQEGEPKSLEEMRGEIPCLPDYDLCMNGVACNICNRYRPGERRPMPDSDNSRWGFMLWPPRDVV